MLGRILILAPLRNKLLGLGGRAKAAREATKLTDQNQKRSELKVEKLI